MATGSLAAYAAHAGVSAPYVTKLRAAGRLVLIQDGDRPIVDFEASDRRVHDTAQLGSENNGSNARGARRERLATNSLADESMASLYRRSQARREAANALLAEIEVETAKARLVERSTVESAVFEAFRALRDRVMAAPRRCAPTVAPLTDLREIEAVIADELRRSFEAFEQHISEQLAARMAPK